MKWHGEVILHYTWLKNDGSINSVIPERMFTQSLASTSQVRDSVAFKQCSMNANLCAQLFEPAQYVVNYKCTREFMTVGL